MIVDLHLLRPKICARSEKPLSVSPHRKQSADLFYPGLSASRLGGAHIARTVCTDLRCWISFVVTAEVWLAGREVLVWPAYHVCRAGLGWAAGRHCGGGRGLSRLRPGQTAARLS